MITRRRHPPRPRGKANPLSPYRIIRGDDIERLLSGTLYAAGQVYHTAFTVYADSSSAPRLRLRHGFYGRPFVLVQIIDPTVCDGTVPLDWCV
ncbi:hypothetical protein I7I48_04215 [Histoplasma ohiense]|nr:hypothetical protein I7I48_04215 [Histoplasma ohiense (nom. inval.)]